MDCAQKSVSLNLVFFSCYCQINITQNRVVLEIGRHKCGATLSTVLKRINENTGYLLTISGRRAPGTLEYIGLTRELASTTGVCVYIANVWLCMCGSVCACV